jgi:hypothetical protein
MPTTDITEFHTALGQFLNYRSALKLVEPERVLYLAVPEDVYNEFFCSEIYSKSDWRTSTQTSDF